MNLGKAIKLCRVQKNLSQAKLSILADISESYLSLLEKGKRDPNISTLQKIADGLDVPISIIFFLAAEPAELKGLSPELIEKLSFTALNLINSSSNESTLLPS